MPVDGLTPVEEPVFAPLTEAEEKAVEARVKALAKLFDDQMSHAKYKIEIRLMSKRSTWKPVVGVVTFWLSGNRFHGGGDEKVYFCPGKKIGSFGDPIDCDTLLSGENRVDSLLNPNVKGDIVCPTCGKIWVQEDLVGERIYKLTPQNWATAMLRLFVSCNHDADIVLKYSPDDIRSITAQEQERQRKGDLLTPMRATRQRGTSIYRLHNIIKDTANGAGLYERFYAYITA